MASLQSLAQVALIGVGATALMDAWLLLLRRFGVRTLDMALIGRWVGHLARGTLTHPAIAAAQPIRAERTLGWLVHYGVGVAFAGLLIGSQAIEWARHPTLLPAVVFGVGSVVAPLFVMQPAMGAGFAASRTPAPLKNCLRSLANHAVFGVGLYLAASLIAWASR
jgi:Protein of unknown function (DUF2938)